MIRSNKYRDTAAFVAGKKHMVDVFAIALLVVASKTMAGGSRIDVEWGTIAFATAALLSMYLTSAVKKAVA